MDIFSSRDCIEYDGKLYFMTEPEAYLISLDYQDNQMRYVHTNNNISINFRNIDLAVKIGHLAYFMERDGTYFIEYNLLTNSQKVYSINCHKEIDGNYAFITTYEGKVIICTRKMGKIVIFDSKYKKISEIQYPDCGKDICFICGCICQNVIYLVPQSGKEILAFDCKTGRFSRCFLNDLILDSVINCICNESEIFVLNRFNEIYELNMRTWNGHTLCCTKSKNECEVTKLIMLKDNVLIMPGIGKDFYLYDLKDKNITRLDVWPADVVFDKDRKKWSKFYAYCEDDNYYYFANRVCNYYLRIDKQNENFIWTTPKMPSVKEQLVYKTENLQEVVKEKEGFFKEYIEYIVKK